MIKIISKLLVVSAFSALLFSCSKNNEDAPLAPGNGTLEGNVTLGTSNFNLKASGMNCTVVRTEAFGFSNIMISGSSANAPYSTLSLLLSDISTTGTYTDYDLITIAGGMSMTNVTLDNTFFSEDKVSVTVTKLTDTEIEGTFSGDIVSQSGTITGKVTNGKFKGRF